MDRFPQKYLLPSIVALGLVLIAGEAWILRQSRLSAARALTALEEKKQERDWVARQSPALSPENEAAIAADLAAAGRLLTELRPALQGSEPGLFSSPPPAKPIDGFFALAEFVEKLRGRATQAQVGLKPDERFGFATYTNEGPAQELIATVHRQRLAVQYLVEVLLESHPLALTAVRRERPSGGGPREQAERVEDFFELERSLSVRQPGEIEGAAFRVEFTGQTGALRNFLNSLATFRQAVVVRSVEVEPLAAPNVAAPPAAAGSPVPLVRPSLSKFAVAVEFVLLADNPVPATP